MSSPGGVALTGFGSPQRRAGRLRRATFLRRFAKALVLVAVFTLVGWMLALATGTGLSTTQWLVALPGSVLCPALVGLVTYAASRVVRREATERLWLDDQILRVDDGNGGQTEYDLSSVPVTLRLRSLMAKTSPRPVWAELLIGADGRILTLSDMNTRQLLPPAELRALADALGRSRHTESRLAAARIRTLISWGSLTPLRGTNVEEIPVDEADGIRP